MNEWCLSLRKPSSIPQEWAPPTMQVFLDSLPPTNVVVLEGVLMETQTSMEVKEPVVDCRPSVDYSKRSYLVLCWRSRTIGFSVPIGH